LITGKTHQIRAHLASIGHPLIGDGKYGDAKVNQLLKQRFGLSWQLLHAQRLEFPPLEGALAALSGRQIQAPLPELYKKILAGMQSIGN
ncbi:MAG: RluA family pseudouridine synthase, partial [Lachnospiraceae bacterium]|nr:RluA family pseudouridine synthase [Lachnospiraceae bacterium]